MGTVSVISPHVPDRQIRKFSKTTHESAYFDRYLFAKHTDVLLLMKWIMAASDIGPTIHVIYLSVFQI